MNRKKKIAILTQQLGFNYGGIIQNYALQKVLSDFGYFPITINRTLDNPYSKIKIALSKYKTLFHRFILNKKIVTYLDYKRISRNNINFIKQHIKLSPELTSTNDLRNYFHKKQFDSVVVGSDQVWRPCYSPDIFNFYLDFLAGDTSIKKIAYAASFGTSDWEYSGEQEKYCSELIQNFNAISVREESGINLCERFLKRKDARLVLDPTLLLSPNDYDKVINRSKENLGLFTYILDKSLNNDAFIQNCANILQLKVHQNQAQLSSNEIDLDKISQYIIPPIEGWLQGFRDAEFVITDSFHGTVFSIINKKPFFVLVNKERGAARFESLLLQLGLEDRMIYNVENFNKEQLSQTIDYAPIENKLNNLREESLQFIKKHL